MYVFIPCAHHSFYQCCLQGIASNIQQEAIKHLSELLLSQAQVGRILTHPLNTRALHVGSTVTLRILFWKAISSQQLHRSNLAFLVPFFLGSFWCHIFEISAKALATCKGPPVAVSHTRPVTATVSLGQLC